MDRTKGSGLDGEENQTQGIQGHRVEIPSSLGTQFASTQTSPSGWSQSGGTTKVQKKFGRFIARLRRKNPSKIIEIWAEDEGRIGLKPLTRRVWSKRGQRPIALQKRGYQWLHTYAFVQPSTGRGEFWVMSHVDTPTMNAVLKAFAKTANPNNDKTLVILWDNAGWHISNDLEVPQGIDLYPILPYTPELSPAEPSMPLLHEAVANQLLTTLDEVQRRIVRRCVFLQSQPQIIKDACGFLWAS